MEKESITTVIKRDEENRKILMDAFDSLGPIDALEHLAYESKRRWKASISSDNILGSTIWFWISNELNRSIKKINRDINKEFINKKRRKKSKSKVDKK